MPTELARIVDLGFKKLAIHQTSYSGLGTKSGGPLGGAEQKSRYKIDCRWSPEYICKKVDKLHDLFAAIEVRDNCCTNIGNPNFEFQNIYIGGNHRQIL